MRCKRPSTLSLRSVLAVLASQKTNRGLQIINEYRATTEPARDAGEDVVATRLQDQQWQERASVCAS